MERSKPGRCAVTMHMRKFLFITLLALIITSGFFVFLSKPTFAISDNLDCYDVSDPNPTTPIPQDVWSRYTKVSVPIPGVTSELVCLSTEKKTLNQEVDRYYYAKDLGTYLAGFYKFFVGIVGILAAVMILYAGVQWVLAAGNQTRIQGAKNIIFSAVIGIVIAFTSYLLLYLLNPALINYDNLSASLATVKITGIEQDLGKGCGTFIDELAMPKRDPIVCTQLYPFVCQEYTWYPVSGEPLGVVIPAQYVACGDTATLKNPSTGDFTNGEKCIGTHCGTWGGKCILGVNRCFKGAIAGTIEYTSNAYVDAVSLNAVCKDGTWLNNHGVSGVAVNGTLDTTDTDAYYSLWDEGTTYWPYFWETILAFEETCVTSHQGLAGFILNVEVNDDQGAFFNTISTADDNFAVDREGKPLSKFKDPKDYTSSEWAQFRSRLITLTDLKVGPGFERDDFGKNPFTIDLNIDRINFPARG